VRALSSDAKLLIKVVVSVALFAVGKFSPWPAWHTPLMVLAGAVMWIPDGKPRPRLRGFEIALFSGLIAALLALELLHLSVPVKKTVMMITAGMLFVLLASIWWDFLKLTGEIVGVLFKARNMIQDARAREVAMGRELPKMTERRGLRLRMIHWFLTAEMPWSKRS